MCDFTMINLSNTGSVTLTLDIDGEIIDAAYDGQEFEIMTIAITLSSLTKVTFTAEQPGQTVQAEGRRWCRDDADPWTSWEKSGDTLTYVADVPPDTGTDWGYEFRFALGSAIAAGGAVVWKDPKMIISRKGQGAEDKTQAAR
jgi:hypothetical protein